MMLFNLVELRKKSIGLMSRVGEWEEKGENEKVIGKFEAGGIIFFSKKMMEREYFLKERDQQSGRVGEWESGRKREKMKS